MSDKINAALFKGLPTLEGAKKNAANPHLKSKYANLSAVMAAVEPIQTFGLWYRQVQHPDPNGACVETIYIHESGEELSAGKTFVKAEKQTPQGFGSALTYARRYSLQGAFGLDAEDDDGHAASQPRKEADLPIELFTDAMRDEIALMAQGAGVSLQALIGNYNKFIGDNAQSLKDIPQTEFEPMKAALQGRMEQRAQKKETTNA